MTMWEFQQWWLREFAFSSHLITFQMMHVDVKVSIDCYMYPCCSILSTLTSFMSVGVLGSVKNDGKTI
jgi:hypothetical protein